MGRPQWTEAFKQKYKNKDTALERGILVQLDEVFWQLKK